jgi:hypothetical protein
MSFYHGLNSVPSFLFSVPGWLHRFSRSPRGETGGTHYVKDIKRLMRCHHRRESSTEWRIFFWDLLMIMILSFWVDII